MSERGTRRTANAVAVVEIEASRAFNECLDLGAADLNGFASFLNRHAILMEYFLFIKRWVALDRFPYEAARVLWCESPTWEREKT